MIEVVLFVHYDNDEGLVPVEISTDIAGDYGRMERIFRDVEEFMDKLYQVDGLSFDGITEYQLSFQVATDDGNFDIAEETNWYPKE